MSNRMISSGLIFSVFDEFFSTTARKDTSYKYAFLKAILDELPDTGCILSWQ